MGWFGWVEAVRVHIYLKSAADADVTEKFLIGLVALVKLPSLEV
jgi:hypothetical protein